MVGDRGFFQALKSRLVAGGFLYFCLILLGIVKLNIFVPPFVPPG